MKGAARRQDSNLRTPGLPRSRGSRSYRRLKPLSHVIAATLCITLTACGTTQSVTPQIVTKTVEVPVVVHCKPDIGPEPDYPDTDAKLKAAPDLFSKVQLLVAGRIMRIQRDAVKSAALSACAG